MSVDLHVYVGYYLRVSTPVAHVQIDLCEGHTPSEGYYCPTCGRGIKRRYHTQVDRADADYWTTNDDRLVEALRFDTKPEDESITYAAIPNANCGQVYFDPKCETGEWKIPSPETADPIAERYAADIKALRACGCTVTLELGVLSYMS